MKLHIFNPEHDLVLANNTNNYTPSSGIKNMRLSFSYVPVFWSEQGDVILTDDIAVTKERNSLEGIPDADVHFALLDDLKKFVFDEIDPWGWDTAIRHTLIRYGVDEKLMPSDEELKIIRNMSHRRNVMPMLQVLRDGLEDYTCGDAFECFSIEDIKNAADTWKHIVIKAPWSSSGINIIYVRDEINDTLISRCSHLIARQGSVMAEPIYNKVKDFAMEFYSDGKGCVNYLGLSVFETIGTAYLNNLTESEDNKLKILSEYISPDILHEIKTRICSYMSVICNGRYKGPFGVDMMIVLQNEKYIIDPCVEINLRRTMGHVAIERWNRIHGM